MPPRIVVETRINKNTVIGTIIAIKNPPQNSSPTGGLVKIRPESTQLGVSAQAPFRVEKPGICLGNSLMCGLDGY